MSRIALAITIDGVTTTTVHPNAAEARRAVIAVQEATGFWRRGTGARGAFTDSGIRIGSYRMWVTA